MKTFSIITATLALGLAGTAYAQGQGAGGIGVGGGGAGGIGIGNGGISVGGNAGGSLDTSIPLPERPIERSREATERGLDNARTRVEQAEARGTRGLDRAGEAQADSDVRVTTPQGQAHANAHAGDHPAGEATVAVDTEDDDDGTLN